MREPAFWWGEGGVAAAMLAPLAALYGAIAARRLAAAGVRADVPVICIGNPTIGGAGKTPTAIAVARMLQGEGERPVLLSRGYGGALAGPVRVDPARHRAADIGDEPLLLARAATTIVARDRVTGAADAVAAGATVIVMDDGFQNPSLTKDCSILVIDARRGIGNGRVLPAGPLRAPLASQFARAQALLVVGDGLGAHGVVTKATSRGLSIFHAHLAPDAGASGSLQGRRVLAFAGIGDPAKFFATLSAAGINVVQVRGFPDHHRYSKAEAADLRASADRDGLVLLTTEKDLARIAGDAEAAELATRARAFPVTLVLDDADQFRRFLLERLEAARRNRDAQSGH
jgi:tetraacyldisaccharide 4'-kinase